MTEKSNWDGAINGGAIIFLILQSNFDSPNSLDFKTRVINFHENQGVRSQQPFYNGFGQTGSGLSKPNIDCFRVTVKINFLKSQSANKWFMTEYFKQVIY